MTEAEATVGQPPRDWLWWGVAATVLCFLPLGLVCLFFALRERDALVDGRPEDAVTASRRARAWFIVTVVVGGLLWAAIGVALLLLGAFSG
jgi:hypothetical protein